MTIERLRASLADRYRIERELGAGGMATVYLAEDLKHRRKVAVKVLRGEISATLGAERFSREISVAANLQHPHILPLLDSGESGGFFYYVMPYIEGESLRDRLAHHGELPIHDAVRIVSEVADALTHAHSRGVVHRDIKPDNIMLSGRHAMVMDFGVAKAVSEATGPHQLTSVGIALGTPSYMAPEQAAADPHLDHRVDIYALGVLAYELLTGRPPFGGRSPQEVLAAQVTQIPDPVEMHRPGVSPALSAVVMKCLAKRAADRWQSAEELVQQLEPLATPSGGMTPTQTRPSQAITRPTSAPRFYIGLAAIVALVLGIGLWHPWSRGARRALDPDLVAVLPFRVAGTDASLQYLRQGMVDLLQTKLTGEGGPRAADTRAVLASVRDAGGTDQVDISEGALPGVARRIGAGKVLQGSIVGPPEHIVISAALLEMPGGRQIIQTTVEGPKDSLFPLVDRLTAQLLALGAGASTAQLSGLTTTSLEALRAYLDGQAEYRRGAFSGAAASLTRAVQLDSTFALALSALHEASGWAGVSIDTSWTDRLAWRYRDRLSERDLMILSIRLGSRYPAATPWDVRIADRDTLTQRTPESADAWYYLGDALMHFGAESDIPDPLTKARVAFEAAVARDSLYAGPVEHLAVLAAARGDTAEQRRWTRLLLSLDSTTEVAVLARWALADRNGRQEEADAILARKDPIMTAGAMASSPFDPATIGHRDTLLVRAYQRETAGQLRSVIAQWAVVTMQNAGRATDAARWLDTLRASDPASWANLALFWNLIDPSQPLDTAAITRHSIPELGRYVAAMTRGDTDGFEAVLRTLRTHPSAAAVQSQLLPRLLAAGDAWLAVHRNAPDADRRLAVFDSLEKGAESGTGSWSVMLARLYESRGVPELALRSIRRRQVGLGEPTAIGLAQALRTEGRLAARVGDRAGAIRAYQRYLVLRREAEPSMIPQRDSVVAELRALGPQEGTP